MFKPATSMLAAAAAALAVLAFGGAGGAQETVTTSGECPDKLTEPSLLCNCSEVAAADGPVWGSEIYTDDSDVCRAALHAGMISFKGGMVWVREATGRQSYPGTTRNGVNSQPWGGWSRSIFFRPASKAKPFTAAPAQAQKYEAPPPPVAPYVPPPVVQEAAQYRGICPDTAAGIGGAIICFCAASETGSGIVWGSGPYTADSSICRAGVHAGRIGLAGGRVTLRTLPGRDSFSGSTRNGVTSGAWGRYPTSFDFDR